MTTITLTSVNQITLGRELVEKIGLSLTLEGNRLSLEPEDASDLVVMMGDADRYYRSIKKPGMAKAAAIIREAAYTIDSHQQQVMLHEMGR